MFKIRIIALLSSLALALTGVLLTHHSEPAVTEPTAAEQAVAEARVARVLELRGARAALATRSAEVASIVASPSESGPLVDQAAAQVAIAVAAADRVAAPSNPLVLELISVPAEITPPAIDPVAASNADLEASLEKWETAIAAARVEREAAEAAAVVAAEQEAALAAEQAAAEAAAVAAAAPQTAEPAPAAQGYTLYPVGTGGQELLDTCTGPVWIPYLPQYLAQHWECGGASFPLNAGAVVTVDGLGKFQSSGVVAQVDGTNSDFSVVPPGYDLYFQTCLNGDPTTTGIVGLTQIG